MELFGIDFESQIVSISCDGCSVMTRLGKNIAPEQQLCQAHGIHLAVKEVMYAKEKKANQLTEGQDERNSDEDIEDDVDATAVDENDNEVRNDGPDFVVEIAS